MKPTFEEYCHSIRKLNLEIFKNENILFMTEFGRAVVAKTGFIVSKVEYVKYVGEEEEKEIVIGGLITLKRKR